MKKKVVPFVVLLLFGLLSIQYKLTAQTLTETLGNLAENSASAYVQPVISGFGSNLNSGWFNRAPSASILGFDLEVKIMAMGSFFADDNKSFATSGTFRFNSAQIDQILTNSGINPSSSNGSAIKNEMLSNDFKVNMSGPTIIGSDQENLVVEFEGATVQGNTLAAATFNIGEVKGLMNDISILPMGGIQLGIGTVYGTTAAFRWFPDMDIEDVGKVSFFGFGFMHNPGVWLPNPLPLDVAVGFFTQTLTVGDIFESKATQFGLFASKTFGAGVTFTPYLGLTQESSTTTVTYDYDLPTPTGTVKQKMNFELEGENAFGITIGAAFKLFVLNISADYKIANTNTASAALSFAF